MRRPQSYAPKSKSKLRLSFDPPGGESTAQSEQNESTANPAGGGVHSGLKRPTLDSVLSRTSIQTHDRPSYSRDYLDELRNSTPSTPREFSTYNSSADDDAEIAAALDVAGKFKTAEKSAGTGATASVIPSAAEIQERKERRARRAKERQADEFISLDDYDSDGEFKPHRMQVSTFFDRDRDKDTRLVRDDEDMAEGYDEFVDDAGKVTLSRTGLREQSRREREAVRELIDEAEDTSDDDDSDAERMHAYEAAQTSHGMDGLAAKKTQARASTRPQAPRHILPIPTRSAVLAKLRATIAALDAEGARLEKRRAEVLRAREALDTDEAHVQQLLDEAGHRFAALQNDLTQPGGRPGRPDRPDSPVRTDTPGRPYSHPTAPERGLETFGAKQPGSEQESQYSRL